MSPSSRIVFCATVRMRRNGSLDPCSSCPLPSQVYDDINSGGEDLNAQQIRKAVYSDVACLCGLDALSENEDFRHIFLYSWRPKEKWGQFERVKLEEDRELILRLFAFEKDYADFKVGSVERSNVAPRIRR